MKFIVLIISRELLEIIISFLLHKIEIINRKIIRIINSSSEKSLALNKLSGKYKWAPLEKERKNAPWLHTQPSATWRAAIAHF